MTRIEVRGLLGRQDLVWNLLPDVNILSGRNGSGKTTLVQALAQLVRTGGLDPEMQNRLEEIKVTFADGGTLASSQNQGPQAHGHRIDTIGPFDGPMREYDFSGLPAQEEPEDRTLFFDLLDQAFAHTGKRIDRASHRLLFDSPWGKLSPGQLSSGEKQLLFIFATVLAQDNRPAILLMDEPEISLHFDWQNTLIGNIRQLNPQLQLILSTHSPAMIMNGWMGHVAEMNDLITNYELRITN